MIHRPVVLSADYPAMQRRGLLTFREGATTSEYAILLGLTILVLFPGVLLLSGRTRDSLGGLAGGFRGQQTTSATTSSTASTSTTATLQDSFNGKGNMAWTDYFGTWTSADGGMKSSDLGSMAITDTGMTNYTYSVDMQTTAVVGSDIWDVTRAVFGFQDPSNYYAVVPKTDGTLELAKMQGGQWVPWLAYAKTGLDPTVSHQYQVSMTGARIQVSVDGTKYIDYSESKPTKGTGVGVVNSFSKGKISNVAVSPGRSGVN